MMKIKNIFSIIKLIDFYFILLTIFYVSGMILVPGKSALIVFSILALMNLIYFIYSLNNRLKLSNYIIKEKLAVFKENHDMLEDAFEDIKSGKFKTLNDFKAHVGEMNILSLLEKFDGKTRFISNLVLNKYKNNTTEIDIIMIHTSGIYVIESKNMYGTITGDEDTKYWECDYGSKVEEFYNPVMQNDRHIRDLRELLAISNTKLYKSFIVFSNRLIDLKYTFSSKKGWIHVIRESQLIEKIAKQSTYSENILSENDVDRVADALEEYKKSFPEAVIKHDKKWRT